MPFGASLFTKSCASASLAKGPTSSRLVAFSGVVHAVRADKSSGALALRRRHSNGKALVSDPPAIWTHARLASAPAEAAGLVWAGLAAATCPAGDSTFGLGAAGTAETVVFTLGWGAGGTAVAGASTLGSGLGGGAIGVSTLGSDFGGASATADVCGSVVAAMGAGAGPDDALAGGTDAEAICSIFSTASTAVGVGAAADEFGGGVGVGDAVVIGAGDGDGVCAESLMIAFKSASRDGASSTLRTVGCGAGVAVATTAAPPAAADGDVLAAGVADATVAPGKTVAGRVADGPEVAGAGVGVGSALTATANGADSAGFGDEVRVTEVAGERLVGRESATLALATASGGGEAGLAAGGPGAT